MIHLTKLFAFQYAETERMFKEKFVMTEIMEITLDAKLIVQDHF